MSGRVLVGMSGGLDSSVAALLLKEQGYDVVGVFLHLWKGNHPRSCCSLEASIRARETADLIGIPLYVIGAVDRFRQKVVSFFRERYEAGETPNPCIECNRHIKFTLVAEQMAALGADAIATGHYAQLDSSTEEIILRRARDERKDQSYFLYSVPRNLLKILQLPLGDWTKERVREYAYRAGLPAAHAPESMDLCFFQDGTEEFFAPRRIQFSDAAGRPLGEAVRPMFFSVGQRKGLGIATGEPLYVREVDGRNGRVVLVPYEGLFATRVELTRVTWVAPQRPTPFSGLARHRSSAPLLPALFHPWNHRESDASATNDTARAVVEFESAVWAPAIGQSLVFYQGDRVICGGIISRVHWQNKTG